MIPAIDVPSTPATVVTKRFDQEDENRVDNDEDDDLEAEEDIAYNDNDSAEEEDYDEDESEADEQLIEKSVLIHRDENGFGLRIKGLNPVLVEHVHENGAAWRAGVRPLDRISKVNGLPVIGLEHKDVVLLFKSCTRFVGLTLLSSLPVVRACKQKGAATNEQQQPSSSSLIKKSRIGSSMQSSLITWNSFRHRHRLSTSGRLSFDNSEGFSGASTAAVFLVGENGRYNKVNQRLASTSRNYGSGSSGLQTAQTARRCESVALRSSLQLPSERRISADELTGSEPSLQDKRVAVCINCRTPISQPSACQPQPQQQREDHLSLSCAQCRVKLRSQAGSAGNASFHKRLYGSSSRSMAESTGKPQAAANSQLKLSSATSFTNQQTADSAAATTCANNEITHSTSLQLSAEISSRPAVQPQAINKRLEIIKEFIDTEKAHTDRLRCLDELFYRPLKTGGFMTSEQLRLVFSCHRTLYKIHRQIYRILLSANYNLYSDPLIGSALLEIFEGDLRRRLERASCTFCAAQSNNVELLNKLTRRDTKVGEFIAQVTSCQMIGRLGIKDLLASCFQRLTKYPLLLENLLKATPKSPPPLTAAAIDSEKDDTQQEFALRCDLLERDEKNRNSRRMLAISLAEEREFIERALQQSRQILVRVNESVKVAMSHNKLKEIWKRTDKYPGVPLIDITKQQVVHEGLLTLRLAKRSFDVYVLLLNDYIIILTREGQDKYRLKFFTPDGKSSSSFVGGSSSSSSASGQPQQQSVYSPVFVIDEHLTTRDAATDENGFYLLCKRKDDSRIYEFASRSPAERLKWRDRIQWTIERQMSRGNRRLSCESTLTKSSSEISTKQASENEDQLISGIQQSRSSTATSLQLTSESSPTKTQDQQSRSLDNNQSLTKTNNNMDNKTATSQPTKIEGTISYVEDDGIVMPSKMESTRAIVDQAIQVSIAFDAVRKAVPSN